MGSLKVSNTGSEDNHHELNSSARTHPFPSSEKGNISGKFQNLKDFHPLEREYNRKISKCRGFPSFEKGI
jgi:hypothetical protein